jgi:hypothetical protein|tara:strand:- start:1203 stop:1478 length:276 start_codon:yes stop_codon:yes gene_type:complete
MVRLIELTEAASEFMLEEVWINEAHVVSIRRAPEYRRLLEEGALPADLDNNHDFTSVVVNTGGVRESHVVVGDVATVAGKFNYDTRTLLKG